MDVYNDSKKLYLIFEYCETDLLKYIRSNPQQIEIEKIKNISYQILNGLSYMHSHRILHRDIKPSNILIKGNTVKLADFGLSRSIGIPIKKYTVEIITMWYRPPELIEKSKVYSSAIDIWGVGYVIAEMVMNEPIFRGESDIDQLHKIFDILGIPTKEEMKSIHYFTPQSFQNYKSKSQDVILNKLKRIGDNGVDLLLKMFNYNPGKRISARESLSHSFFYSILN